MVEKNEILEAAKKTINASIKYNTIRGYVGCRQLVSWDVGLSPATSATPILCYQQVKLGTHGRLPGTTWRKAGMTSNHHAPYDLGYTRATMA